MIEISKNNIFIWLYNRGVNLSTLFFDRPRGDTLESGDRLDVCKFFRRILLWTPLTLAFYGFYYFIIYKAIYTLFFLNPISLTIPAIGWFLLAIIGVGAIAGTLLFITVYLSRENSEVKVIKEYVNSIKERTCVLLRVK